MCDQLCLWCEDRGCSVCGNLPSNVTDIFTRAPRFDTVEREEDASWNSGTRNMLSDLLAAAEKGQIKTIMFVGTRTDDTSYSGWSGNSFEDPYMHIGMLEAVKARLNDYLLNCEYENEDDY